MDSMNGIFDSILKEKIDDLFFTEKKGKIYRFLLDSLEKPLLERVLRYSEGNKVRAAKILGMNRNTLRAKLKRLGMLNS